MNVRSNSCQLFHRHRPLGTPRSNFVLTADSIYRNDAKMTKNPPNDEELLLRQMSRTLNFLSKKKNDSTSISDGNSINVSTLHDIKPKRVDNFANDLFSNDSENSLYNSSNKIMNAQMINDQKTSKKHKHCKLRKGNLRKNLKNRSLFSFATTYLDEYERPRSESNCYLWQRGSTNVGDGNDNVFPELPQIHLDLKKSAGLPIGYHILGYGINKKNDPPDYSFAKSPNCEPPSKTNNYSNSYGLSPFFHVDIGLEDIEKEGYCSPDPHSLQCDKEDSLNILSNISPNNSASTTRSSLKSCDSRKRNFSVRFRPTDDICEYEI